MENTITSLLYSICLSLVSSSLLDMFCLFFSKLCVHELQKVHKIALVDVGCVMWVLKRGVRSPTIADCLGSAEHQPAAKLDITNEEFVEC